MYPACSSSLYFVSAVLVIFPVACQQVELQRYQAAQVAPSVYNRHVRRDTLPFVLNLFHLQLMGRGLQMYRYLASGTWPCLHLAYMLLLLSLLLLLQWVENHIPHL